MKNPSPIELNSNPQSSVACMLVARLHAKGRIQKLEYRAQDLLPLRSRRAAKFGPIVLEVVSGYLTTCEEAKIVVFRWVTSPVQFPWRVLFPWSRSLCHRV